MYFAATIRNHAKLTNLSYAAAGHTGFEPTIAAGTVADYWRGDKTWQALPAATPGGSDGQVQYNNGGVFGGAAGFTYDDATGQVAFTLQADVASGNAYSFAGADAGELTAASGVQPFVSVTPRIRHTGTASWIGLYVNPTVISSGSGAQVAAAFMGGNVGIGTSTPAHKLTVRTPASDYGVEHTDGNARLSTYVGGSTGGGWLGTISNHKLSFFVNDQTASMTVDTTGNVGIGTTSPYGLLDVNGTIFQRGASLHADYVFEPSYELESIEDHSQYMWANKHLQAVPVAAKDDKGQDIVNWGERNRGVLEELEKAHVYIQQLDKRVKELEEKGTIPTV